MALRIQMELAFVLFVIAAGATGRSDSKIRANTGASEQPRSRTLRSKLVAEVEVDGAQESTLRIASRKKQQGSASPPPPLGRASVSGDGRVSTLEEELVEEDRSEEMLESSVLVTTEGADTIVMIGGVPIYNYASKEPAAGSDVAQLLQNDEWSWTKNAYVCWIGEVKPGVSQRVLHQMCSSLPAGASCIFEGDVQRGLDEFVINATENQLAKVFRTYQKYIKFAEPDMTEYVIPDDMESPEARLLETNQAPRTSYWGLDRIDDRQGLDGSFQAPNTGAGVHVYVMDTGIRTTHRDFGDRAVPLMDTTSGRLQLCRGKTDTTCAADRHGHGTHCAGSCCGTAAGVAKQATVYAVKACTDGGSCPRSYRVPAYNWVLQSGQKPAVISLSVGGRGNSPSVSSAFRTLVDNGIVVVVAAGNDNEDACGFSPAFAPDAITVGAIQRGDLRASYSNFGRCIDLFAPGSQILSATHTNDQGTSTKSGTSMACPHVAGAAALLVASGITNPRDVTSTMLSRATRGSVRDERGSPDLLLYVGADGGGGGSSPPPPPPPPPQGGGTFSARLLDRGTCASIGMFPITLSSECEASARALGLSSTTVRTTQSTPRPQGCYYLPGNLLMATNVANVGRGADGQRQAICKTGGAPPPPPPPPPPQGGGSFSVRLVTSGTCAAVGMLPITLVTECEASARALRLQGVTVVRTQSTPRPEGCYALSGGLYMAVNPANKGRGADGRRTALCKTT